MWKNPERFSILASLRQLVSMAGALKFSAFVFLLLMFEFGFADQLVFDESEFIPTGERTRSVVAGDFNSDGHVDLVVNNSFDNNLSLLLGLGGGLFEQPINLSIVGFGGESLATGDFNSDGFKDIAVARDTGTSVGSVRIFLGQGNGGFNTFGTYTVAESGMARSLKVADFNCDGIDDLVVVNWRFESDPDRVVVLLGIGDGSFEPQQPLEVGDVTQNVISADFNDDGVADLATTNLGSFDISILIGLGNGGFLESMQIPLSFEPIDLSSDDFNGDHIADLAITTRFPSDAVVVMLGNGNGTFADEMFFESGHEPFNLLLADFDGDRITDIASPSLMDDNISILLGFGNGMFSSASNYPAGDNPRELLALDIDDNDNTDIIATNWADDGGVSILFMNDEMPDLLLGDINRDCLVNLLDVSRFIDLLTMSQFQREADINQDGLVDLLDVAPFVDLLTGN